MPESLCSQCAALCCRYFALPIDNPSTRGEYDDIRWYLCHENVTVFIEKGQWYIGLANRCKHLQADNRCGIYLTRPRVCRSYSTDNCDYHGGEYEFERLFTSAEQLAEYAEEKLAQERQKRARKAARAGKRKPANAAKTAAQSRKANAQKRPVRGKTPRRPPHNHPPIAPVAPASRRAARTPSRANGASGGNGSVRTIALPLLRP